MARRGDLNGTRMVDHKCGTCKHFEAAPMWKKGWCRNPLLYSQQQSHLVGEEDLDCNRGMGSYWEPIDSELPEDEPVTRFMPPQPRTIAPAQSAAGHTTPSYAPPPQHERSGPRRERTGAAPVTATRPRTAPRRPQPVAPESPEAYATPPDDRTWGDYLRRSFPAIGVILLLGVLWVWSSALLAGRPADDTSAPLATVPANLGQGAVAVIVPSPTAPVAAASGAPATAPAPPPGVIAPGAKVVVNSAGDGARIRQGPTLSATTVLAVDNGTVLTITGASQDADGYTWWPVQGDGFSGWVAGALIEPAP